MAPKRQIPLQLFKLAEDLGLKASKDPIQAVLSHCDGKISNFLKEMGECYSLSDFLTWIAARVGTTFEVIDDEDGLQRIKGKYLDKGEKAFVNLENELSNEVFGITYRLQNRRSFEPLFVSIIDRRGEKGARAYFTKWHEIAHLLTLTEQMRLVFRRTHSEYGEQDAEEKLMDLIAGRFGFYSFIFHKNIQAEISFDEIERLRSQLCSEASLQASMISFTKYWPTPCIHIRAELGFNKDQKRQLQQNHFGFVEEPQAVLRIVSISINEAARELRFGLFENMRVPTSSVLQDIYANRLAYREGVEDLADWTDAASGPVKIKARFRDVGVDAFLIPV